MVAKGKAKARATVGQAELHNWLGQCWSATDSRASHLDTTLEPFELIPLRVAVHHQPEPPNTVSARRPYRSDNQSIAC
jgi:hypothetical protein